MMKRHAGFIAGIALTLVGVVNVRAEPEEAEMHAAGGSAQLGVKVIAGSPPKPVSGATVSVALKGRDDEFDQEKKTNAGGTVVIKKVPKGKVVIQVTAEGWATSGIEFDVRDDKSTATVTLKKDGG